MGRSDREGTEAIKAALTNPKATELEVEGDCLQIRTGHSMLLEPYGIGVTDLDDNDWEPAGDPSDRPLPEGVEESDVLFRWSPKRYDDARMWDVLDEYLITPHSFDGPECVQINYWGWVNWGGDWGGEGGNGHWLRPWDTRPIMWELLRRLAELGKARP